MSTSVDLSKGIAVFPPSIFLFLFSSFLFFYFFVGSLVVSIYLSFVLFGIFCLSSFGIICLSSLGYFPHFKGNTLYFTRSIEDLHTLQEVLNIKKMKTIMMYANVCLFQFSVICNDTSALCGNYKGKGQLSCGSSIKQNHV